MKIRRNFGIVNENGETIIENKEGIYTGNVNNQGKKHGWGTMQYKDGDFYGGFWKDDKKEGDGTMRYQSGDTYFGFWEDDKKKGIGRMEYQSGDTYFGFWEDDKPMINIKSVENNHRVFCGYAALAQAKHILDSAANGMIRLQILDGKELTKAREEMQLEVIYAEKLKLETKLLDIASKVEWKESEWEKVESKKLKGWPEFWKTLKKPKDKPIKRNYEEVYNDQYKLYEYDQIIDNIESKVGWKEYTTGDTYNNWLIYRHLLKQKEGVDERVVIHELELDLPNDARLSSRGYNSPPEMVKIKEKVTFDPMKWLKKDDTSQVKHINMEYIRRPSGNAHVRYLFNEDNPFGDYPEKDPITIYYQRRRKY